MVVIVKYKLHTNIPADSLIAHIKAARKGDTKKKNYCRFIYNGGKLNSQKYQERCETYYDMVEVSKAFPDHEISLWYETYSIKFENLEGSIYKHGKLSEDFH
jgi:hypothetical protein